MTDRVGYERAGTSPDRDAAAHERVGRDLPALCGCVPGHRMTVNGSRCLDCGLTEVEVAEGGNRSCDPRFPPTPGIVKAMKRVEHGL
jgi:hypothetical protein